MSRHRYHEAAPPAPIDLNPRREPALDFPWREFGEMTPADYDEIGLLCGLEVHQQLRTRGKLFCRCPAGRRLQRVDAELLRHMRPTLSEMGLYDGCALMEFKTRKEIVYLLDRECVCTYEMDDTPPFDIDREAVEIALRISRLFGMSLVSELQVMRKQYLDGSIPTGFQRTAMVAVGGILPFPEAQAGPGEIRIRQLTLEEDACREVSDVGHRIVFETDRLGTPLTEVVTEPEFLTPRDAVAGARLIAAVARASGNVRRGLGAARQDVNVSIAGSRRIELKGVAHHRGMARLVHVEAFRQLELLRIRQELLARGAAADHYVVEKDPPAWETPLVVDAGPALRASTWSPVFNALHGGHRVLAVRLPRFGGLLTRRTQTGVTLRQEFAERVRVIACLTGDPFLLTSDDAEDPLGRPVWDDLRRELGAEELGPGGDVIALVWGSEEDAETAVREIVTRAADAVVGVPSETRQTHPGGVTGLERILPGPERMYPDTDTPPVPLDDRWVQEIEAALPERPWEREARYVAAGMSTPVARCLSRASWADLFDALAPREVSTATRLAHALKKRLPRYLREGGGAGLPAAPRMAPLVAAVDDGRLLPEAFETVMGQILVGGDGVDAAAVVEAACIAGDERERLAECVTEVTAELAAERGEAPRDPAAPLLRRAMGRVMPRLLGRVAPADVRAALAQALGLVMEIDGETVR